MKPLRGGILLMAALIAWRSSPDSAIGQTAPQSFRSGIELVEVPVLVRDGNGRFVPDLIRDQFRVLEEGVEQTVTFFERVAIPIVLSPAPTETPIARDVATNDVAPDSRVFVLLLDSLHVAPQRVLFVKKYARQFIEQHVGPADLVAIVSPGALPSATQDFTSDRARLLAAVEEFSGNKLQSASVEIEEERKQSLGTGVVMHGGRDPSDPERANRVQSLVSTLNALATHLSTVERRRKALLLFSEGIDYNTGDFGGFIQGKQRYAGDVIAAMERGIAALVRTGVALYAIDPRGLSSAEGDALDLPIHGERPSVDLSAPTRYGEFARSIQSLRHLAEATGGFAAVDRNDFTGAFQRIMEESSNYYMLGYAPAKPAKPGEVRRIEVRVARPGVSVVARKMYSGTRSERPGPVAARAAEVPPMPGMPTRAGRTRAIETLSEPVVPASTTRGLPSDLRMLLASPLPRSGLPIRVQAIPFKGDGRKPVVTLVIELSGQSLTFQERGGRFRERIQLALLTLDERARADNGATTTLDLRLTRDEMNRVKTTGVRWLSRITLSPGRHQVRVAARAELTNTSGSAALDIDVPRFESDRLSLSGVVLTSLPAALLITRGDGKVPTKLETPPATSRTFVAGDRLTSAIEVYIPPASTEDVEILAWVEPTDPAIGAAKSLRGAQRVPPSAVKRDAPQEVAFTFDTAALVPGRYLLRITVQPAGNPQRVERTVMFDIVAPSR